MASNGGRTGRAYLEQRQRLITQATRQHLAGHTPTCPLCQAPLDPTRPTRLPDGTLDPWAPTLEHPTPLAHGGPILDPRATLAHRRCQWQQGGRIRAQQTRRRRQPGPDPTTRRPPDGGHSRNW